MSFVRGERVHFDFDTGEIDHADRSESEAPAAFVGDILERNASPANPPTAPTFKAKANATGFPAHRKRATRISAFKQQRAGKDEVSYTSQQSHEPEAALYGNVDQDERHQIDEENRQRIAEMSPEEIEQERKELLSALSPSLIQRLLGRSNIEDGSNERDWANETPTTPPTDEAESILKKKSSSTSTNTVSFETPDVPSSAVPPLERIQLDTPATLDTESTLIDTEPLGSAQVNNLSSSIHFPTPAQPPDLDPNSPSFLQDLHQKYFPNLPYDPSSLSWMTPIDPSDTSSPYHPSQIALNASELRFNFKGALLPPSRAREISASKGLHHHADAPEAAGYTIPELAILARSAVAAQRCVAYQTLGRILYRLGTGEFGEETEKSDVRNGPVQVAIDPDQVEEPDIADEDEAGSAMAAGLWKCIEEGKVIETLTEEATKERGHLTARTFAQEALWNWRRGGGRKRKAV